MVTGQLPSNREDKRTEDNLPVSALIYSSGLARGHLPGPPHVPPHPVGRGATLAPTSATPAPCLLITRPHPRQDLHLGEV